MNKIQDITEKKEVKTVTEVKTGVVIALTNEDVQTLYQSAHVLTGGEV